MSVSEIIEKTKLNIAIWESIIKSELTGDLAKAKRELNYYQAVLKALLKKSEQCSIS